MNRLRVERIATCLVFLFIGLAMAGWAPLVPYAKQRLELSDGTLGLLLLCLGAGSMVTMPLSGVLAARLGCRVVALVGATATCLALPYLAVADSVVLMGLALAVFGAAIGALDVVVNILAVSIEKRSGRALMSSFHGMFSIGGFLGAGAMAWWIGVGLTPFVAATILSALMAMALLFAQGHLYNETTPAEEGAPFFVVPHGPVILIGVLCMIVFLAEGAVLDWSALFLVAERGVEPAKGGMAYFAFSIAMTAGRFTGDAVVRRFGALQVLLSGALCSALGFFLATLTASPLLALVGFVLVGLGAANIVPILFSIAGRQRFMPGHHALAAVTTLGYTGILVGPALIGFVAQATSLPLALAGIGLGLLGVAACAPIVARKAE